MDSINNPINKTIQDYTTGEITLEAANQKLRDEGAKFYLDPGHNALTASEIAETETGETPADAYGMGLLDSGTGILDKVFVRDGKLVDVDLGKSYDLCIIGGKTYHVQGNTLTD